MSNLNPEMSRLIDGLRENDFRSTVLGLGIVHFLNSYKTADDVWDFVVSMRSQLVDCFSGTQSVLGHKNTINLIKISPMDEMTTLMAIRDCICNGKLQDAVDILNQFADERNKRGPHTGHRIQTDCEQPETPETISSSEEDPEQQFWQHAERPSVGLS